MRRLIVLSLVLIVAGCVGVPSGSSGATPKPLLGGATASPSAGATQGEPTDSLGPFQCSYPFEVAGTTDRAQISGLRVEGHPNFDRLVFEFLGLGTAAFPTIDFTVSKPPFSQDPSGQPLSVDGGTFLVLTMHGGTTVDPDGRTTYDGSTDIKPDLATLKELVLAGDFEALSTWIIGLGHPTCVRVTTLTSPNRLVIDLGK